MPPRPDESGYADVNGVKLYYATYGTGDPLILLHGGLGRSSGASRRRVR